MVDKKLRFGIYDITYYLLTLLDWNINIYGKTLSFSKRVNIELKEPIPKEGPCLILPNHCYYSDPIWLAYGFYKYGNKRHLTFVMHDQFFGNEQLKNSIFNWLMKRYGAHIIKREPKNLNEIKKQINHLVELLCDNNRFITIFPARQRSRTGEYNDCYKGKEARVVDLVYESQKITGIPIKILPVGISYNPIRSNVIISFGNIKYLKFEDSIDENMNYRKLIELYSQEIWNDIGKLIKANLESIGACYLRNYCKKIKEIDKNNDITKNEIIYEKEVELREDLEKIIDKATRMNINIDNNITEKKYFNYEFNGFIKYWTKLGVINKIGTNIEISIDKAIKDEYSLTRKLKPSIYRSANKIAHYKDLTEIINNTINERISRIDY